jgi:hypothetical protein
MGASPATPCVSVSIATSIPSITLPMGIQLQAIADLSKGPPTNCALMTNLMGQLMPTLAGLNCIIKILNVIGKLEDFLNAFPNLTEVPSKAAAVVGAITDMSDCLSIVLGPFAIIPTIKDILTLIISFLLCFVEAMESILNFQVGLDLNAAQGNPNLLLSMQCASDNAEASMQGMMLALAPVEALFGMIQPLIALTHLPIQLPSLSSVTGASNIKEGLDQLQVTLQHLNNIVVSL